MPDRDPLIDWLPPDQRPREADEDSFDDDPTDIMERPPGRVPRSRRPTRQTPENGTPPR